MPGQALTFDRALILQTFFTTVNIVVETRIENRFAAP